MQNQFITQLKSDQQVFDFLKKLWINNFSWLGFDYLAEEIFEKIKNSQTDTEFIQEIDNILQNSDFKKISRKNFAQKKFKSFQFELIKPYLKNVNNLLDFGCGKMALLRRIAKEEELNDIKHLFGYDPNVNVNYADFDNRARFINKVEDLFPQKNRPNSCSRGALAVAATSDERSKSLADSKFDLIISSYVFHHMTITEIEKNAEIIKKLLAEHGKLILIEESFENDMPDQESINHLNQTGFETNNNLTEDFLKLSLIQRKQAIYLNDVLINYKNLSYIPWTLQYKTMIEWESIFTKARLKLQNKYFFGFIQSGRLKQGITSMQVFTHF